MSRILILSVLIPLSCVQLSAQGGSQELRTAVRTIDQKILKQIAVARADVVQGVNAVPSVDTTQVREIEVPQPPKRTVRVVSTEQQNALTAEIGDFAKRAAAARDRYATLATTGVVVGAVLALVGAVLSFLSLNRPAGIVSLVVAAVIGAPSVYPLVPLATFYRVLAAQGRALELDCKFQQPQTVEQFESATKQLKLLILYEGENRPELGNAKDIAQQLSDDLQVLKTAANVQLRNP